MKGKIATIFFFLSLASCAFFVNESDTQSSTSIRESKRDNVFICRYNFKAPPNFILDINEVWMEYYWQNEVIGLFFVTKEIDTSLAHIVISMKGDARHSYDKYNNHFFEVSHGNMGFVRGNIIVHSLNRFSPDKVNIDVYKQDSNLRRKQFVGTLRLTKAD